MKGERESGSMKGVKDAWLRKLLNHGRSADLWASRSGKMKVKKRKRGRNWLG